MRSISKCLVAFVAMISCAAASAEAATHPHDRNGFMIGFGLGVGSLGLENADERETSVTGNFRIGWAVRQDLVLGIESNGWARQFDDILFEEEVTITSSSWVAAVTYYPPPTGFFLRGGIGVANIGFHTEVGGLDISDDESGLALLFATGHEWRLTRRFALAPQIEFTYHSLDELESSTLISAGLGFNWYW